MEIMVIAFAPFGMFLDENMKKIVFKILITDLPKKSCLYEEVGAEKVECQVGCFTLNEIQKVKIVLCA